MTTWMEDQNEREIRHRAEVAALNEQIDRLLADLRVAEAKANQIAQMKEQIDRLSLALDEALSESRARNAIQSQMEQADL